MGLDSILLVAEFERPQLDLVAVLTVSGSMSSEFDSYYCDEHGRQHENSAGGTTKLDAATEALCALTAQLRPEDRLGIVLYNDRAHVAKPLRNVGSMNMRAIRQHIREIAAGGGTNLADGFEAAWDMLADGETTADLERRVVFMTDMMPNTGATGEPSPNCSPTPPRIVSTRRSLEWGWTRTRTWRTLSGGAGREPLLYQLGRGVRPRARPVVGDQPRLLADHPRRPAVSARLCRAESRSVWTAGRPLEPGRTGAGYARRWHP